MADASGKKRPSIAEIMAAARRADGKGSTPADSPAPEEPAAAAEVPEASGGLERPAAAAPKPAAKGARPSVAEIMALARAKKDAGAAASPATSEPVKPAAAVAKPNPAAAKPAAKRAADAPAKAGPQTGVRRDTASILEAARAGAKPGPVSKADAPPRPVAKPKPPAEKVAAAPKVAPPMPARPAAAKKADGEDRRGFMEIALGSFMAIGFTALSVTGGLFSLGLARFFFPNVLAEPPSKFKVGSKDGFPFGKVETKFVAQYGVWVVNGDFQGDRQIYALKTVCTHLGCTPSWLEAEQKFKCPCHGSGFYKDGVNFEGPAPRPLERYAIRIADDGQLEIDKSRTFHEELGQWADPDSFVIT